MGGGHFNIRGGFNNRGKRLLSSLLVGQLHKWQGREKVHGAGGIPYTIALARERERERETERERLMVLVSEMDEEFSDMNSRSQTLL